MSNQPLRRIVPAALLVPLLIVLPASGQTLNEDAKLAASCAAQDDLFGQSVAISGTTAIVGAPGDDGGDNAGSAYLIDATTGAQIAQLTASDAAPRDQFGFSVAISGTTAIVGAPLDNDAGTRSGSAYLFDTTTCTQIAKLTASDAAQGDRFGFSVAISGTTAIVGALGELFDGSGWAYLFDITTGQQLAKLTASDAAQGDQFGFSVAISGTTAIVGAYQNDDAGFSSGSVYLFDFSNPNNIRETKLTASDAAQFDQFGYSVAISGTTAIVGAFSDSDAGSASGSAYLFNFLDPNNIIETKLTASDAASFDQFGNAVAISGSTAIVGAFRNDDAGNASGSAYLFDTTTGVQFAKLTASNAAPDDQFGSSVAISSTTAIVGAPLDDDAGNASGSAYIFDYNIKVLQQPQSTIVDLGAAALFQVVLADTSGMNYQWRRDGVDLADGGNISGSNTAELQIIAGEDDLAFYDCVLTRSSGPAAVTDQVVLGVRPDPNACYPDANGDGVLDFFDISQFIIEFGRGCP